MKTLSPFHHPEFARTLFAESGDAMFLVDPDTDDLLDINLTALRLTGFAEPELLVTPATTLFRYERGGHAQPANPAKSAAQKTTVFHGRDGYLLRTKSEPGWRPVTLTVTRLHLKGQTLALFTARDDSERRAALELVRRSESRFRALVEKSSEGIAILDADATVRYASPAGERILGFTPFELEGRVALALVHPDDLPFMRDKLAELLAAPGREMVARCRAQVKGGGWRLIDISGVNRLADPAVSGLVLNVRDVTDRVRAEEEAARQHGLMKTLFDAVPDVVVLKDRDDRFVGGNPAFERMAGCKIADLVGRTCRDVFPAAWADRVREIEARVLATGATERSEMWVEYADGRPRLLDMAIAPTTDAADGRPTGLAIIGRDLTDRKQLEDQLREAQKMEAVGQLAGGVAHDFNNLLTVVLGNLDLARQMAAGTPADDLLKGTEKAARRAADLTGQLLGFARKKPMRFEAVDLNQLVAETAGLLRRTIDPRVVLHDRPRPHLWATRADPGQMAQVLMNLCLNARDAMPAGGHLTVGTGNAVVSDWQAAGMMGARPGKFVRLRVADTGHGMDPQVKARMFEPFFTTKATGRGTGLGLAVVFGIVQAHGGWVACESAPDEGTTFEVYLPMYEAAVAAQYTPAVLPSPLGRGEAVLVADDEPMIRTLAKSVLTKLGYEVTVAADGREAVAAFAAAGGAFAAVVLDLTMPNLSGREALDRIREQSATVPVILASGYSADQSAAGAVPGVRYLDKPYAPSELAKAVREVIDGSAVRPLP